MDGSVRALALLALLACCVDDAFGKWSIVVQECMVVEPGKIPGTVLEPGMLPGSNRLSGIQCLTVSTT